MKKPLSLFLAVTLTLALTPCVFAEGSDNNYALQEPAVQIYSCLTEGYGANNTEVLCDNEKIVISISMDGFSASFGEFSNSNGQKNKDLMDSTKANFISLSQLFSVIVSNAGFPDAHVYLYLKDDLNEENTILALLDGELKYDLIEDASSPNSVPTETDAGVEVPSISELYDQIKDTSSPPTAFDIDVYSEHFTTEMRVQFCLYETVQELSRSLDWYVTQNNNPEVSFDSDKQELNYVRYYLDYYADCTASEAQEAVEEYTDTMIAAIQYAFPDIQANQLVFFWRIPAIDEDNLYAARFFCEKEDGSIVRSDGSGLIY